MLCHRVDLPDRTHDLARHNTKQSEGYDDHEQVRRIDQFDDILLDVVKLFHGRMNQNHAVWLVVRPDWNCNGDNIIAESSEESAVKGLRCIHVKILIYKENILRIVRMTVRAGKSVDNAFRIRDPDTGVQCLGIILQVCFKILLRIKPLYIAGNRLVRNEKCFVCQNLCTLVDKHVPCDVRGIKNDKTKTDREDCQEGHEYFIK